MFQPPKIVILDEQNERISNSASTIGSLQCPKCSMELSTDCDKTFASFNFGSFDRKDQQKVRNISIVPNSVQNLCSQSADGKQCDIDKSKPMKSRTSKLTIRIPSHHLKRILKTQGVKSLQRETQHFVGVTSVNGLLRVYRSRGAFRLFWITVTALSLLLLLWQITKLVQLYFSRPTASQISFLLNDNGLPFPTVTICSHRPIRAQYVESLMKTMNISQRLLVYIMLSFMDVHQLLSGSDQQKELRLADEEWKEFTHFLQPKFTVNAFFWNASATCEQMLKQCSFGGRDFDCCKYAKGILTDIGKCYQLDLSSTDQSWMRRSQLQQQSGMNNNGLQIIVDAGNDEHQIDSKVLDTAHPFARTFDIGIRYYVHEQYSMPYLSTEGISVSPGTKVYSAISPTHYVLLPQEMWGNCSDRWPEDLQGIVNDGAADERYSSSKCKTLCRAKYFNELCGCSPFSYNVDEFYSICTPYEIYKCFNSIILNDTNRAQSEMPTSQEDFHQIIPNCPQCKIECQRWVYHTYNSYAEASYPKTLGGRLRRKATKWSNFMSLNIFYRDMAYTEYKQVQSLSMTEILSDIGGNMGLFLGMSLISLIEFVTYICKISWLFISKKRRDHMLAKKSRDEQREQRLQQTLEMSSRANNFPTSQFDTIIDRISRSIRRKPARVEKSVFILPVNSQRQSAELDTPSTKDKLPIGGHLNSLKRSQSMLSSLFGEKKSVSAKVSTASRRRNLVDSIIESRLHGNAGRATRRNSLSSSASSSEDGGGIQINEQRVQMAAAGRRAFSAERKEQVELSIDLDSKTVLLVGPLQQQGRRRYSTSTMLSWQSPTNAKNKIGQRCVSAKQSPHLESTAQLDETISENHWSSRENVFIRNKMTQKPQN